MVLTARTIEDLEHQQEVAISLAKEQRRVVECQQRLKVGGNDRCPCGSGRKWKVCCQDTSEHTVVTFYPPGYVRQHLRPAAAATLLAGLLGYVNGVQ